MKKNNLTNLNYNSNIHYAYFKLFFLNFTERFSIT